jgi:hypothetical protein
MPEKRILHAENYWQLSCLGYVFSNIESWDIKFIKVKTWNKIPMSHKVTFKRIPHISGASLSGSAGDFTPTYQMRFRRSGEACFL